MEDDRIYFARRAAEERRRAEQAAHPTARQVHLDLAERYQDLASAIGRSTEAMTKGGAAAASA